jgi:hypothetical protein
MFHPEVLGYIAAFLTTAAFFPPNDQNDSDSGYKIYFARDVRAVHVRDRTLALVWMVSRFNAADLCKHDYFCACTDNFGA